MKGVVLKKKDAVPMEELIARYIREMKLASGLNTRLVFSAWDSVSGASAYTLNRFYKGGILYISLNSSVVRNQLSFQKAALVEKINEVLTSDPLFVLDDPRAPLVKDIVFK